MSEHALARLSKALNAPEAAVRLLISILLGFPIAFLHRYALYGSAANKQHIFFILCGLGIGYWNYEYNILHSFAALSVTYASLKILGSTYASVLFVFLFNMIYLLYGYYTTSTQGYDIKWTMPQCVLTLRLSGLAFNLWDGQKPEDKLSETQKKVALKSQPTFLEVAAFTYFPGSFLIGPQFSMKRYLDYVHGRLNEEDQKSGQLPDCIGPGIFRAILGFSYVAVYQLGISYVSDQYLLEPAYERQNFFKRLLLLGLWGQINLYKYVSCWLITEGVCTAFGLTYNGKDENGNVQWNGCENVKLLTFERAIRFHHYILSFNINTNHWCAEYIYKRLRFLGSRLVSQMITLFFLAIWHGFHSGYYAAFFLEFVIMYCERDLVEIVERSEKIQGILKVREYRIFLVIMSKLFTFVLMGYCLISFCFLSYERYMHVYANVYYFGHVVLALYLIIHVPLRRLLLDKRQRKNE